MLTKKSKLIIKIVAIALTVIAGIMIIVGIIIYSNKSEPAFTPPNYHTIEYNGKIYSPNLNRTNVLLIGTDTYETIDNSEELKNQHMGDYLCLLSFDILNKKCYSIHINRDTMTNVKKYSKAGKYIETQYRQITYAYSWGFNATKGSLYACSAVSELLSDIRIDYYATINLEAIAKLNDLVGGVEVYIEDDFSKIDTSLIQGQTIKLQGIQAEHFVRARHHVGDGENLGRMRRQKVYMQAFFETLLENDISIENVFKELDNNLATNINVKKAQLLYDIKENLEFKYYDIPGTTSVNKQTNYMEYTIDKDALTEILIETLFKEVE